MLQACPSTLVTWPDPWPWGHSLQLQRLLVLWPSISALLCLLLLLLFSLSFFIFLFFPALPFSLSLSLCPCPCPPPPVSLSGLSCSDTPSLSPPSVCLKDVCLSQPLQPLGVGVWGWLPDGSPRPFHCPWTLSLWVSLPSPFSGRLAAAFLLSPSPLLRPLGLLHLHHLLLLPRLVKMSERNSPSPAVWGPGWTSTPACGQHGGMPTSDHLGSFCHFPPLYLPLHSECLAQRSPPHPQSLLPHLCLPTGPCSESCFP